MNVSNVHKLRFASLVLSTCMWINPNLVFSSTQAVPKITDLKAKVIDCSNVELSWSDVAGESAYRIRRKKEGEATFINLGDVKANVTKYNDKAVQEGVTYVYQVRPMENGKAANVSNNPSVKIPTCEVDHGCPTSLPEATVTTKNASCGKTDGSITFSFPGDPKRMDISFSINGGSKFTKVKANSGSYTFTGLAKGTYSLVSKWGNGECPTDLGSVTLTQATCDEGPGDVTDLKAVALNCGKVKLTWSDASGETGYRIRRKLPGGNWKVLKDVPAGSISYTDGTVEAQTTYVFNVRPMVDGKPVKGSNKPQVKTPACEDKGCETWFSTSGVWKGKGRIAISSDGNEHDKDDWAATPFSLALLASKGLQSKLSLYTYSDHVWGSNHDHSDARQQMRTSALQGAEQFGFDKNRFVEAVANPTTAYNRMRDEINKSSINNPLFIVAAGPMQVVGEGLKRANPEKRKFVTVISHSKWNDRHSDNPSSWENHSGWTWAEMENAFKSDGVTFDHIMDQNGGTGYDGMRANASKFEWLKTSAARNHAAYTSGSWAWLYKRQEAAKKGNEFDPSDAGMIIYLLTGKEKTDPSDAKKLMEAPVKPCSFAKAELILSFDDVIKNQPLELYPNPGRENFHFTLPHQDPILSIALTNMLGEVVDIEYSVDALGQCTIRSIGGEQGTYVLLIGTARGTYTTQLNKLD